MLGFRRITRDAAHFDDNHQVRCRAPDCQRDYTRRFIIFRMIIKKQTPDMPFGVWRRAQTRGIFACRQKCSLSGCIAELLLYFPAAEYFNERFSRDEARDMTTPASPGGARRREIFNDAVTRCHADIERHNIDVSSLRAGRFNGGMMLYLRLLYS